MLPVNDPERHLKKLKKVFGVSARIQKLAIRRKKSLTRESKDWRNNEMLTNAKQLRTGRINSIDSILRYVLEIVAHLFGITIEEVIEGMADSDAYLKLLESFSKANGKMFLLFFYDLFEYPSMESGRFIRKNKYTKIKRAICSDGYDRKIPGKAILIYRLANQKDLDLRTLQEEIFSTTIQIHKNQSVITAVSKMIDNIHFGTCDSYKDYGLCKKWQKDKFLHDLKSFGLYLKCTDDTLQNIIEFHIDENLYKGHLLADHQIKESAGDRPLVYAIEIIFCRWLRQIQIVLTQGQQIRRDSICVGPLNELEYWHRMLLRYASIVEFISDKPFQNHLQCLQLSKSKFIKKWKELENNLTFAFNEAIDNVRYIGSLERYWDPLYRYRPNEIIDYLPSLLMALRFVYTKSRFYNTSDCVASFLVKITNQLTLSCKSYLTDGHQVDVLQQSANTIFEKIDICIDLLNSYHFVYDQVLESMEADDNEAPWTCSPMFIFGILETFIERLKKIKIITEINEKYSILTKIRINGMDQFLNCIVDAYQLIANQPYDILDQRIKSFDCDFDTWQMTVDECELEMQKFVRNQIEPCSNSETMLLILIRFERLQLDCLCLDRRYLDVAVTFERELEQLKDIYNFERENPPIGRCVPPVIGRIMWIRSLQQKIDKPMNYLRTRKCVIEHRRAQMSVKYYNFLSEIFLHYEMQYHKAWYDYVNEIEEKLACPILLKSKVTNHLEINFHSSIMQLIRESEGMLKLNLSIPYFSKIIVYCKEKILNARETLKDLIKRNDSLRMNINMILLNITRPLLKRLELAFKPGLSTVQWTSKHLDDYFQNVDETLIEIGDFIKKIGDIKNGRIRETLESISDICLVALPEKPIQAKDFLDLNVKHRQIIEKTIELKSLAAEYATVELINEYVTLFGDDDDHDDDDDVDDGKTIVDNKRVFQLPLEQQNENNRRTEELLPIDKYDWLQFDKIYRPVQVYPEGERSIHFFKDYEDMHYGLQQLHIDCMDVFSYCNGQAISAMVKCIKRSMEQLKRRTNLMNISSSNSRELRCEPIILTDMKLDIPVCRISPNLECIQNNFALTIRNIVETFYAVTTWGKQGKTKERKKRKPLIDEIRHERNFFQCLTEHLEVVRIIQGMDGGLLLLQPDINNLLVKIYNTFSYLWDTDRDEKIEEFVRADPLLVADICDKFNLYDKRTAYIENLSKIKIIGAIEIHFELALESIAAHSRIWKTTLGKQLNALYKKRLNRVVDFINDMEHILNGKLMDLDDVRIAMDCLEVIRETSIELDMELIILIEVYSVFARFHIQILQDDYERVDSLRYSFDKMINHSKEISTQIIEMQQPLLIELHAGIAQFKIDIDEFDCDFMRKGPLVDGIPPKEASDRTFLFQNQFDELWRKYQMYSNGELLFGLPHTDYPILNEKKIQLELLTELYALYVNVLKTMTVYLDMTWSEINTNDIQMDINIYRLKFDNLPKDDRMYNWKGYLDLKELINNFIVVCPLLTLMTSEAMKERHWLLLEQLMNYELDVENAKTTLGTVMQAPIILYQKEVREICEGAEKERNIEIKLREITTKWSNINIDLVQFKARGEILLNNSHTLAIIDQLSNSILIMNTINQMEPFNLPFKKEILIWLEKLQITRDIVQQWINLQNLWIHLEGVFIGSEIARQLPAETKRFRYIDKNYIKLVLRAREIQNCIEICTNDETMHTMLPHLIEQLESVRNVVQQFNEQQQAQQQEQTQQQQQEQQII